MECSNRLNTPSPLVHGITIVRMVGGTGGRIQEVKPTSRSDRARPAPRPGTPLLDGCEWDFAEVEVRGNTGGEHREEEGFWSHQWLARPHR